MAFPLGVSVQEGVTTGASPFQEGSKHNVAILWERERGIPNKAIKVTSLQEDAKLFGGVSLDKFGAYIARHLFNNAGQYGAVVYGIRPPLQFSRFGPVKTVRKTPVLGQTALTVSV